MRARTCCRQLSVAAVVLGLWVSSTVFAATACTMDACRDDCDMHRLVQAHEMAPGQCDALHQAPVLTARCTCGAIHAHSTAPATVTDGTRSEGPDAQPLHLAALPTAHPHLPFYARFTGKEPIQRIAAFDASAGLGLRAPPTA